MTGAPAPEGAAGGAAAARVQVFGLVQGVAFRWHTRERARALGLRGWVRNLRDGSVEVHVEGDPSQLAALLEWLRSGPPHARVERFLQEDAPPEGHPDFAITG